MLVTREQTYFDGNAPCVKPVQMRQIRTSNDARRRMSQSRNIVTNDLSSSHCGDLEKYEAPNGVLQMAKRWDGLNRGFLQSAAFPLSLSLFLPAAL